MLALVALLMLTSGLPSYIVLIAVALLFALIGLATEVIPWTLLTALPARITGLLETDIVQALPLYVAMGALLNRLPLADTLFRAVCTLSRRATAAPLIAAIGLGTVLAPMNGSVGASVATLSRVVLPRLISRGVAPPQAQATIAFASTLGVVVPPSLVLILLGDIMLRAHTEAITATGALTRVINTQDIFRGALLPAAILVALALARAWRSGGEATSRTGEERLSRGEWATAGISIATIVCLLGGVVTGRLYAVEAAATGAVLLFLYGLVTGSLRRGALRLVLDDAMAVTGALFALFLAATTFTLVFRAFGSDLLLARWAAALPGGRLGAAVAVIVVLWISAFILDAFEIILVIVPLIMPPLLQRAPDAVWLATLALLSLQASFIVPPFGYAVVMARSFGPRASPVETTRALLPFLALQILVLGLVLAFPQLTHPVGEGKAAPPLREDELRQKLEKMVPYDDDR